MDVIEAIRKRRSIRKYIDKPVSDEIVKELLEAAMLAPSAGNNRPWHFIVVKDRKILDEDIPRIHQYAGFSKQAALAIIVCGDTSNERYGCYWNQDCAAAIQTLLLAATGKGLGTCWCGVFPRDKRVGEIRELFAIPEHVIPMAIVTIGYPGEQKKTPDRYDESRIHNNTW